MDPIKMKETLLEIIKRKLKHNRSNTNETTVMPLIPIKPVEIYPIPINCTYENIEELGKVRLQNGITTNEVRQKIGMKAILKVKDD